MSPTPRNLSVLPEIFAICRLAPEAPIPNWAMLRDASFFAVTQTRDELSIICSQSSIPDAERGSDSLSCNLDWRCLKLEGPFDLDEPGVLAALVSPLAAAGISVFAEATYDTDYMLVNKLGLAIETLQKLGHTVKS